MKNLEFLEKCKILLNISQIAILFVMDIKSLEEKSERMIAPGHDISLAIKNINRVRAPMAQKLSK